MAENLGEAVLELRTNQSGLDSGLNSAESKTRAFGSRMTSIGGTLTAALTVPLTIIGGASIKAASDAEEMGSKFDAVFKELAAGAKAWADQQAGIFNRSTLDLQTYLAQFQDTFVPLGFARDQAAELSKQLTTLGVDLASFNNVAESTAIDSLTSALVGNHEAVRGFGVIITQATLSQELLNMGIQGGVQAATEQEKVMARLAIIMQSTSDAQGDAARTSASFANQMKGLLGQLDLVAVQIGAVLIPVALQLSAGLSKVLTAFLTLDPGMQTAIVVVGGLTAVIGPLLIALGAIVTAVSAISAPVLAVFAAAGVIGTAIAGVVAFVTTNEEAMAVITEVWESVQDEVGAVLEELDSLMEEASEAFAEIWEEWGPTITAIWNGMWTGIGAFTKAFLSNLLIALRAGLEVLKGAIQVFTGIVTGDWQSFSNGLKTIWSALWRAIKAAFSGPITAIQNRIKSFTDSVKAKFESLGKALVFQSIVPDMIDAIGEEFQRLGTEIEPGVGTDLGSIGELFGNLGSSIGGIVTGPLESLKGALGSLGGFIPDFSGIMGAFSGIVDTISGAIGSVGSFVGSLTSIAGASGPLGAAITGAVSGLVQGLFSMGQGEDIAATEEHTRFIKGINMKELPLIKTALLFGPLVKNTDFMQGSLDSITQATLDTVAELKAGIGLNEATLRRIADRPIQVNVSIDGEEIARAAFANGENLVGA